MIASPPMTTSQRVVLATVGALIGLGLSWELWVAPLRPGGSMLALKVLPLIVCVPGLAAGRVRMYQWWSMGVLLYLCEGLVRAAANGQPALTAGALRFVFGGDPQRAVETARMLAELGYVERHWQVGDSDATPSEPGVWDERWVLAPGAARMTLRPLFDRMWAGDDRVGSAPLDVGALDRPLGDAG